MPLQPLVRSPRPLQPLPPPQRLVLVVDRDLPVQVKVTRVDLLQLLIPPLSLIHI